MVEKEILASKSDNIFKLFIHAQREREMIARVYDKNNRGEEGKSAHRERGKEKVSVQRERERESYCTEREGERKLVYREKGKEKVSVQREKKEREEILIEIFKERK